VLLVAVVFYSAKKFVGERQARLLKKVDYAQAGCEALIRQKEKITLEKMALERQAKEIFILYEMTKEITKKASEQEAFEAFKEKLKENVTYRTCRFIGVSSDELKEFENSKSHFIFLLKSKKERLGYLVLEGLSERDVEKVSILGNQFALALRRVKLYEEIEELAITDSLTGVHTRRYLLRRLEEELKRSESRDIDLSVLMADVDHFKNFNDRYGHLVGDQILRFIGELIRENIREIDIVGRYGGEEFCVILPDTDRDGANFAAERIRSAIEKTPVKAYDITLHVTISIGVSVFPGDGKNLEEVIDKADWALYRAKKKGRNCVCSFGVY